MYVAPQVTDPQPPPSRVLLSVSTLSQQQLSGQRSSASILPAVVLFGSFILEFVEPGTVAGCVSVPTLWVLDLTQVNQEPPLSPALHDQLSS